jgi:hypothetical protein
MLRPEKFPVRQKDSAGRLNWETSRIISKQGERGRKARTRKKFRLSCPASRHHCHQNPLVRCCGFFEQAALARTSRTRRQKTMPDNDPSQARSAKMAFAFYGRVGRDEPVGSAGRQRLAAEKWLREGGWSIVSVYIDTVPRTTPWAERPQARALLNACARPAWAVTAVVTGGAAQAFGPDHLCLAIALLGWHGARLWAPEFGGAADPGSEPHSRGRAR